MCIEWASHHNTHINQLVTSSKEPPIRPMKNDQRSKSDGVYEQPSADYSISENRKNACLLILGMHRSGTSALARVLNLAGAALPNRSDGLRPGQRNWTLGIAATGPIKRNSLFQELGSNWLDWTALDLTKLPSRHRREVRSEIADILLADYPTSRLWVVKDPRICRYAKMFLQSLDEANVHVCPIIALRNPLEVCASLAQRTAFWSSDLTRMDAALLWLRHMLEAEAATRNRARVIVSYSALLDDWPQVLTRISCELAVNWPHSTAEIEGQVGGFLSA